MGGAAPPSLVAGFALVMALNTILLAEYVKALLQKISKFLLMNF
jgi:hypothetical protein